MLRSRIIPSLLIEDDELVKTVSFKNPKYVGDPINAVRIFNEKNVDELMIYDISVSRNGKDINFDLLRDIALEARMPLCYGGGIKNVSHAQNLISLGFEKISISSAYFLNESIISDISQAIGVQSVVLTLDIRKTSDGYSIFTSNGDLMVFNCLQTFLEKLDQDSIGELVINSIDGDGNYSGFDINLAQLVREYTVTPVTYLGGIGSLEHMKELINEIGTIGIGVGSFFTFHGPFRAVLISYNKPSELLI